jgi:cyanophycinase
MAPWPGPYRRRHHRPALTERGRKGRLVGAVAQNPKNISIGIDEQTAIIVEGRRSFYALGFGAVYITDGTGVAYSNIAEEEANRTLSIYDLKLHVLSQGDRFNLDWRRPERLPEREAKKLPVKQPE